MNLTKVKSKGKEIKEEKKNQDSSHRLFQSNKINGIFNKRWITTSASNISIKLQNIIKSRTPMRVSLYIN